MILRLLEAETAQTQVLNEVSLSGDSFCNVIRKYSRQAELTHDQLAKAIAVSRTTLTYLLSESTARRKRTGGTRNIDAVKAIIQVLTEHEALLTLEEALFILKKAFPISPHLHTFSKSDQEKTWYKTLETNSKNTITPEITYNISDKPALNTLTTELEITRPLTEFIGRDEEIKKCRTFLSNKKCRLLTITGPGGIGKTRLALEVAALLEENTKRSYKDKIIFIDLVDNQFAANKELGSVLVKALGLTSASEADNYCANQNQINQLSEYLKEKDMLIVLDNFEQMVNVANLSLVGTILSRAKNVQILITSREILHLEGEQVLRLSGLTLPPENITNLTTHLLENYSATALFLIKVKNSDFDLANQPASGTIIVELCRKLDGIPHALILAAAHILYFTPQKLLGMLTSPTDSNNGSEYNCAVNSFNFLSSQAVSLPFMAERHRSLELTYAWSFNLLSLIEKRLFAKLALFRGGFTLEAVSTICTETNLPTNSVIELLCRLIDKSLIQANVVTTILEDGTSLTDVRYTLLELTHQYARIKFGEMFSSRGAAA